jgi:demethoxyubiquinone hydroxylase (CLK1/Coq7/Cat5 family)
VTSAVATGSDGIRADLIRILQNAHAGELAAAYAYRGHWRSVRRPAERMEIARIEGAEWHHRNEVFEHLTALGAAPRPRRELLMGAIGRFFGALCLVGGWFAPMYAAGRLEAINTVEYETARAAAAALDLTRLVAALDDMIAEEIRHEVWFGDRCRGHWLLPAAAALFTWHPDDRMTIGSPERP